MQVRDSAIFEKGGCGCRCGGTRRLKNYYKYFYLYFLYIFTIKIFLKNTYYALIHKKRKKNASFGFSSHIQGRFWPFPACFGRIGRRPIRPDMADKARFWPNQPGSTRIEADSARIKPHWRESSRVSANPRKKKKRRRSPTRGQPCRTPHPASRHVGRGCGTSGAASVLSRLGLRGSVMCIMQGAKQ